MQAVAGTPNAPMVLEVIGGTFYNHPFNGDRAPLTTLVAFDPIAAFDSFVTIGVKMLNVPVKNGGQGPAGPGQNFDNMTITPDFPGLSGQEVFTTTSGWAITPDEPQADPFNQDFVGGNGEILIAQFATANGFGFFGTFLVQYISNGQVGQSVVTFAPPVPGVLALFGVGGLIGTGSRRRAPRK